MEAHTKKSSRPIADELEIPLRRYPFQLPFSILFNVFFFVLLKIAEGYNARPQNRKQTQNWNSKGAQTETKDHNIEPQRASKY